MRKREASLTDINAFWWSPNSDRRLLFKELRRNPQAWWRLSLHNRRLPTNFGDELTPLIVSRVVGARTAWAPAARADLIAVGSILEYTAARAGATPAVWGSGLRNPLSDDAGDAPRIRARLGNVLAVRGPRTRRALSLPESTVLGDPGLLVASVAPRASPRRSGTVYIPHFRSWASRTGLRHLSEAKEAGLTIVTPAQPAGSVLESISSADLVLSSSLHGIICAHSYGVPVIRVGIPGAPSEPEFKYGDYLESVGLATSCSPISATEVSNVGTDLVDEAEAAAETAKEAAARMGTQLVQVLKEWHRAR